MPGPASPRVGWGIDAHRLDGKPPLLIGGVIVSRELGVSATSDGDVLAHAITDAVLGAAVLSDIGAHFPSDEASSRDASSLAMLAHAVSLAAAEGWEPVHVDATIAVEQVRISPFRDQIRENLARVLGLETASVSVKATTTDGLGLIGAGEGVVAMAVVTVTARS